MGMKSIEERAKEFAQNFEIIPKGDDCEDCDTCTKCNDYRRYVDIVTEQKTIDIKKACEWLHSQMKILYDDEWYESNIKQWMNELKKAMEE